MALKQLAWLTGLCAALVATSAYSQHREAGDVYIGGAIGYNIAPDAEDEAQAAADEVIGAGQATVSVDDGVFGWSAYGGIFVADALAVEAGYLGNADMDLDIRFAGVEVRGDWSMSAFYGALVAHVPMSDGASVSPFFKAGLARWDMEYSAEVAPGFGISVDDDGTDLLFGAGVDVPISEDASIRGEWMMLLLEDDDGGSQHRFQVGLNIAF